MVSWSRLISGIVLGGWLSTAAAGTVSEPVLKWQQGGCYASWCETGFSIACPATLMAKATSGAWPGRLVTGTE